SPPGLERGRTLLIGGEPLHYEDLSLWRDRLPETRIINEYGPTEATVGCVIHDFRAEAVKSGAAPIGRPIANTQVYLLDPNFNPAPTGVPAELHIGGAGLARGYIRHPEFTAEKFTPDPFTSKHGQRLYKTGDLGRCLPDDNIDFLGRLDHQVKIRGYRVELGEIENLIKRLNGVRQALAMIEGDQKAAARLVAYVVPGREFSFSPANLARPDSGLSASAGWRTPEGLQAAIRSGLRETLPDYMVPSEFIFVEEFPVTANGKVDREALRKAKGLRPGRIAADIAPH